MEWSVERDGSEQHGSEVSDGSGLRGLIQDLEHRMANLSALLDVVRDDPELSTSSGVHMRQAERELARLLDFVTDFSGGPEAEQLDAGGGPVDVRAVAGEVAQLAQLEHGAEVVLLSGERMRLDVRMELLWRVLANILDNAARAAGPDGRVEVSVRQGDGVIVEISDNGPGFGHGPRGTGSVGLTTVTALLRSVGGRFEIHDAPTGGTLVRVLFPGDAKEQRP
jgi:signal transduction histidine kinase